MGSQGQLWGIVLAGGDGVRLHPSTRRLYGEDRPKQFAALHGSASLLRQTLDRVGLAMPDERTLVVTQQKHAAYVDEALDGARPRVLSQPEDRDTAFGVLLPIHWVHRWDPEGIVAVFPADHYVGDEQAFMQHIGHVADFVAGNPDWTVLVGAPPTEPAVDCGWIEAGERLLEWSPVSPIRRVKRFWEDPPASAAVACFEQGWLWNTSVFVGRASRLLEVAGQVLPALNATLAHAAAFVDTRLEAWAIGRAAALGQKASFSREFFEPGPGFLAVSCLPPIPWYDLGTPEGVVRCFRSAGLHPTWLDAVAPAAVDGNSRGPKDHTPRQAEVPHGDRNDLL